MVLLYLCKYSHSLISVIFCESLIHKYAIVAIMDLSGKLVATGLNQLQAEAYLLLLDTGRISPPNAARKLGISRTNSYKLFERLEQIGIAKKVTHQKVTAYEPSNPMALSSLVSEQRNIAAQREDAVRNVLGELTEKFESEASRPSVVIRSGKKAVIEAYKQQMLQKSDVYFLRSRSDIPTLGFDAMHDIRITPERHGQQRFGITPDRATGTNTSQGDSRSALTRTWMKEEDYTAPVEWSASGSSLVIVVFGARPYAITIQDKTITEAFLQIWKLLDSLLRSMPYYKNLPR